LSKIVLIRELHGIFLSVSIKSTRFSGTYSGSDRKSALMFSQEGGSEFNAF
jgi:hypothetical protein